MTAQNSPRSPHFVKRIDTALLAGLLTKQTSVDDLSPYSDQDLLDHLDHHGISFLADEQKALPSSLNTIMSQRKAMAVASEAIKQKALAELFDAFSAAGINAVLFKGSALAYALYPNSWLRPRSDSDVLILPSDKQKADTVLQQQGFTKLFAIEGEFVSHQSTYGKQLLAKSFLNIDLHWQINNRQMFATSITATQLIENGQQLSQFGAQPLKSTAHIPSHVDSLLIAAIHQAGHHNKEERLAWVYDIHILASSLDSESWNTLTTRAIEKRIAAITLKALSTSQAYFRTNIEQRWIDKLAAISGEASAVFLNTSLSERHYFWADLKTLASLRQQLTFIRENLLPSPTYVKLQMQERFALVAYVKRFWRGVKRIF